MTITISFFTPRKLLIAITLGNEGGKMKENYSAHINYNPISNLSKYNNNYCRLKKIEA